MTTIKQVQSNLAYIASVFKNLLAVIPSFEVGNTVVLPFGLKPHTRSVSWIAEQVITQQLRYNAVALGLNSVQYDMPDSSLHNCIIEVGSKKYWVNVKIHDMNKAHSRSDISAVEKLYKQYVDYPDYELVYVCLGIHFVGTEVKFDKEYLEVFSPQFLPLYVNPRNDKIQANYHHIPQPRSRAAFLAELKLSSPVIKL